MSKVDEPYEAKINSENHPYVDGPGTGLSYYGETLFPGLVCGSEEEAKRAAVIANMAFAEGFHSAQLRIQEALGLRNKK